MSGTTTEFLSDNGQVTEGLPGSTYNKIYGAAAEKLSGTVFWMLQDGQPSTRQLLNSSQTVVDTYTTDAFGNSVARTGTAVNPFQWNAGGKYYSDYESGLQKVGARYYEPATGRWISQRADQLPRTRLDPGPDLFQRVAQVLQALDLLQAKQVFVGVQPVAGRRVLPGAEQTLPVIEAQCAHGNRGSQRERPGAIEARFQGIELLSTGQDTT